MKKLVFAILIVLISFIGFNTIVKAVGLNELYFTYSDGSAISNNTIELSGSQSVNVNLYVQTSADVFGAVIPWSVGSNINVTAVTPTYDASEGASIFYKISTDGPYTKRMVFDSSSAFPSSGSLTKLVHLATFAISAPNLAAGSSQTIELKTQEAAADGGVHAVIVGQNDSAVTEVTGTTLTITKAGGSSGVVCTKEGDFNKDGEFNDSDVLLYMRYIAGLSRGRQAYEELGEKKKCVDLNNDNTLDDSDALLALRKLSRL